MNLSLRSPHRRYNPLLDEWVLCSPHRLQRPWQGQVEDTPPETRPAYDPSCYLCPGNIRANGQQNPAYTHTFAFDNDFPALLPRATWRPSTTAVCWSPSRPTGRCRVICFSPRHDLTLAEMAAGAIRPVVDAWAEEVTTLGAQPQIRYVQVFENKGAMMGCSNPHPHCQVWATGHVPVHPGPQARDAARLLREPRPRPARRLPRAKELAAGERIVFRNEHWVALVPFWAVWPFETMLVPVRRVADLPALTPEERDALADALRRVSVRYDNLFRTSFPYSMGFHARPTDGDEHPYWRLHAVFYPPLLRSATVRKFLVGYELTAEPQRDLTAEDAAARLRAQGEVHYRRRASDDPDDRAHGIDPLLLRRARERFAERFGAPAPRVAVAPGRVNLIGEHTDYNDGFVLPMAIGSAAVVVFRPRDDRVLRGYSVAFDEESELRLDALAAPGGSDWMSYVAGVAWAFASEGLPTSGLDVVVDGDVPIGAGPVVLGGARAGDRPRARRGRRRRPGTRCAWRGSARRRRTATSA